VLLYKITLYLALTLRGLSGIVWRKYINGLLQLKKIKKLNTAIRNILSKISYLISQVARA